MRLIDADKLSKPIYAEDDNITGMGMTSSEMDGYNDGIDEAWKQIVNAPTVDAAPVRRGCWEDVASSFWRWTPSGAVCVPRRTYQCGLCGRGTAVKSHYCPNCGAKMDGEPCTTP